MKKVWEKCLENDAIKKRFVKDCGLSINVFDTEYFLARLKLFRKHESFLAYLDMIAKRFGGDPQAYLEYYNSVKDQAIDFIKESQAYQHLQTCDMKTMEKTFNLSSAELYRENNVGKIYISMDMRKANFTALVHYGKYTNTKFYDNYNYESFIGQFTDVEHITKSKYIRQVIFGNCNPKRQIAYESYMMDWLLDNIVDPEYYPKLKSFRNDEIIFECSESEMESMFDHIKFKLADFDCDRNLAFPVKIQVFKLHRIDGSLGYLKWIYQSCVVGENGEVYECDGNFRELKCINPDEAPFIYRFLDEDEFHEDDYVFSHDGKLAKFLAAPSLSIVPQLNML